MDQSERRFYEYNYALLELEQNLEEEYGYLGLDFRERNVEGVKEMEVCGYPARK